MSYSGYARAGARRHAQAYASVGLETEVLSARPEQLITLLLDGALMATRQARVHLQQQEVSARGTAISKAIDIIETGLKASVDTDAGGELAQNLIRCYDTAVRHLLLANLNADEEALDTAHSVLDTIAQAWRQATEATPEAQTI